MAGYAAALASAGRGARTVLVEPRNAIGGNAAQGLHLLGFHTINGLRSAAGITEELSTKTVELMDAYPSLMARDCLHAAHCLIRGLEGICSFDTDFDSIEGIRRIEPAV